MGRKDTCCCVSRMGGSVIIALVLSIAMIFAWGRYSDADAQQTAPSKAGGGQKIDLNLITTPTGTGTYTIGVGQGMLLSKKLPNYKVAVQPASGALALPRLLATGEGQIITIAAPTVYWAYRGEEDFSPTRISSIRLLQAGNDMYFAFITRPDTGIQGIEQLKGRRVTYEIPSARLITKLGQLHLQAFGLDPKKDVTTLKSEFTTTALQSLVDKRTDAIMGSLGGSKMAEAESKVGLRVLSVPEDKGSYIRENLPVFFAAKTPAGLPGVTPNVPVVATAGITAVNSSLDDSVAYALIKTLLENHKELFPIHPDFHGWTPERAVKDLGIPYHPGAIKYYKEKGLWTNEMDQRQKQMLATGK